jgi:hypothetical protein
MYPTPFSKGEVKMCLGDSPIVFNFVVVVVFNPRLIVVPWLILEQRSCIGGA